jgi:hypothetical protein
MEEAPLLLPVQRIVGGVEVEGDLRRWCRMGVNKQIDKQPLDRRRVIADLVVAGLRRIQLLAGGSRKPKGLEGSPSS